MIAIRLNDKQKNVDATKSLQKLMDDLGKPVNGVAIAINNEVIPKDSWNDIYLKENDNVLIIRATQGG